MNYIRAEKLLDEKGSLRDQTILRLPFILLKT